jgi:hypothetical protein
MSRRVGEAELANPSNDAERDEALLRLKSLTLTGKLFSSNSRADCRNGMTESVHFPL